MSTPNLFAQSLLRLEERLRQERAVFDQRKEQEARWFSLRLRMGYAAVFMLPAIGIVCFIILLNRNLFDVTTVAAASTTLFVDVAGFIIAVWRIVLNPGSVTKLEPTIDDKVSQYVGVENDHPENAAD